MPVLLKKFSAAWRFSGLTIKHVFVGLGWYPYCGPSDTTFSHQARMCSSFPPAVASSAYQHCVTSSLSCRTRGSVPVPYMAMGNVSPCVVPSLERMCSPPMNSLAWLRYVLTRIGARTGQSFCTFLSAACRLRAFKALDASTNSMASVLSSSKHFSSIPLFWSWHWARGHCWRSRGHRGCCEQWRGKDVPVRTVLAATWEAIGTRST